MVINISQQHSLVNNWINELRDVHVQQDRLRFRRNIERIGEIIAYEISKKLPWVEKNITTPLGVSKSKALASQPVLATILRAGLPLHQGMLNYFDNADNAFIAAYRKHQRDGSFEISLEYLSSPNLDGRVLILCDPMLATGNSMNTVFDALKRFGIPKKIYIASAIATKEALDRVSKHFPGNTEIFVAAIDRELTAQSYIVPGLGDAGDLAFGVKI